MIRAAHTELQDSSAAAEALREQLSELTPTLVIYFASARHGESGLAAAMARAFGAGCTTLGCTTAGELTQGKMLTGGIAAMAMDADALRSAHAVLIRDPADADQVRAQLSALASAVGGEPGALDPARYLGLVLQDGMSGTEERVMEVLSSACNVPIIGGSAGDDRKFESTHVFLDGEAHRGAALLALLEPARPYHILKTQSFEVLPTTLTVTRADQATRTVHELDGKPAAQAYADAIGVPVAELPDHFMRHPLGLVLAGGEPFVRSPRELSGESVAFYCDVKPGTTLHVLEARDIVVDTQRDLGAALAAMPSCAGILNFHCILRTLELEAKGQCEAYGALFRELPTAGFSTYGESYIGHINQTSTMVLFE